MWGITGTSPRLHDLQRSHHLLKSTPLYKQTTVVPVTCFWSTDCGKVLPIKMLLDVRFHLSWPEWEILLDPPASSEEAKSHVVNCPWRGSCDREERDIFREGWSPAKSQKEAGALSHTTTRKRTLREQPKGVQKCILPCCSLWIKMQCSWYYGLVYLIADLCDPEQRIHLS